MRTASGGARSAALASLRARLDALREIARRLLPAKVPEAARSAARAALDVAHRRVAAAHGERDLASPAGDGGAKELVRGVDAAHLDRRGVLVDREELHLSLIVE